MSFDAEERREKECSEPSLTWMPDESLFTEGFLYYVVR